MIPHSIRLPGVLLLVAGLLAALLPNLVSASASRHLVTVHRQPAVHLASAISRLERTHNAAGFHRLSRPAPTGGLRASLRPNDLSPSGVQSLAAPLSAGQSVIAANRDGITGSVFSEHDAPVGDLSQLDNASFSQLALYHPHPGSYEESGVEAALSQTWVAQVNIPADSTLLHVFYLATVYPNQAAAVASGDWALTSAANLGLSYEQPCTRAQAPVSTVNWTLGVNNFLNNSNTSCTAAVIANSTDVTGESNTEIYTVADYGNVLEEVDYNIKNSDLQNAGLTDLQQRQLLAGDAAATSTISYAIEATVENAVDAGGTTPPPPAATATPTQHVNVPPPPTKTPVPTNTPTPTSTPVPQPSVKLAGVGLFVEHSNKKYSQASSIKSAQQGLLVAQIDATNLGAASLTAHVTYSVNGKTVASRDMRPVQLTTLRSLVQLRPEQATQTLDYGDQFGFTKLKKAIKLSAQIDVAAGQSRDSTTVTIPVKTNCTTKNGKKKCK